MTEGPSTFSKQAKEGFPRRFQSQAYLPVHIVMVEFQLNSLPDNLVHIAGYSRKVPGVLKFYDGCGWTYVLPPPMCLDVQIVCVGCALFSGLNRSISLYDVHVLTEYAVYPHCPQSQVLTG